MGGVAFLVNGVNWGLLEMSVEGIREGWLLGSEMDWAWD